jgi:hypothetical protein
MKFIFTTIISALLCFSYANAQKRIIDTRDHSPIPAASIFDASGNMVGYSSSDGLISDIPETAYPITIHCIGYELLVIEHPEDKTWEMTPTVYNLKEVVVVPIKRNVLKQTFYVREYYSMYNSSDTVTFFTEHMANRFVPTTKGAKFGGKSSLNILNSRQYSHYNLLGIDSVASGSESKHYSLLTVFEPNSKEIAAPESFKDTGNTPKYYEKVGKSGTELIQKQNSHTFTTIKDVLADTKEHKLSPGILKLLGLTMEFNQVYFTHAYQANDSGVYQPKDLIEASLVIQADGRGKYLREAMKSETPVIISTMIELYVVDQEFLTKEEAKKEYKNKPTDVEFVIPSTVPPLSEATRRLVERAKAETNL